MYYAQVDIRTKLINYKLHIIIIKFHYKLIVQVL
jgi:hypothetical protein